MREQEVFEANQATFLDDILGPKTAGEAHFDDLPRQGSQEWLDEVSSSRWFRKHTGHTYNTITLGGSQVYQETTEADGSKDPFFETPEEYDEGVER